MAVIGCGSHQPALKALAKFTEIRSVIEFGAGIYSTRLFLNHEEFPDLMSLVTFENDKDWAQNATTNDERYTLVITHFNNFKRISKGMCGDFVFVDCAPHDRRLELLDHGLTLAPIIGFHDCKIGDLKHCDCRYIKDFNGTIQTVFMSDTIDLSTLEIAS